MLEILLRILKLHAIQTRAVFRYSSTILDLDSRWRYVVSFSSRPKAVGIAIGVERDDFKFR
jgi:hypothetical protein